MQNRKIGHIHKHLFSSSLPVAEPSERAKSLSDGKFACNLIPLSFMLSAKLFLLHRPISKRIEMKMCEFVISSVKILWRRYYSVMFVSFRNRKFRVDAFWENEEVQVNLNTVHLPLSRQNEC